MPIVGLSCYQNILDNSDLDIKLIMFLFVEFIYENIQKISITFRKN